MAMGRNNCLMVVATQCQSQCKEQRVTVAIDGGSDIISTIDGIDW
jgi:hypothetical protein